MSVRHRKGERGQALAETALFAMLAVLMAFGLLARGRVFCKCTRDTSAWLLLLSRLLKRQGFLRPRLPMILSGCRFLPIVPDVRPARLPPFDGVVRRVPLCCEAPRGGK
jgi:hypothetical protein